MSVIDVMDIATAASERDSAKRRATLSSGFVLCHAAVIRKASSTPIPRSFVYKEHDNVKVSKKSITST